MSELQTEQNFTINQNNWDNINEYGKLVYNYKRRRSLRICHWGEKWKKQLARFSTDPFATSLSTIHKAIINEFFKINP